MLKKVDKDPFSNGTEFADWDSHNCDRCVKASRYRGESAAGEEYTKGRCAIQRDILSRMMSNEPIAQRTIEACSHWDCPYRQEHHKKYPKRVDKNQPTLF